MSASNYKNLLQLDGNAFLCISFSFQKHSPNSEREQHGKAHIAECPFCMNNICFEFLAVQWSFFDTAYQKRQIYMQANEK